MINLCSEEKSIRKGLNFTWRITLIETKTLREEEFFHDKWAGSINIDEVMVDESFEACTAAENRLIIKKLGDLSGKKILDLGCGAGEASIYLAKKGAQVTATDISKGMLEVVNKVAQKHNVEVFTKQSYSHQIDFDDETFDIVYAANLLHHVDIELTILEVFRVLKNGGIFVSWDPLAHNPIINIYRQIAKEVRTDDEHPLKFSDLKTFRKHFRVVETYTTWLFTLWIFIKFFFGDKINPNKERYWKKIIIEHKKLENLYFPLEKLDHIILKIFPFLRRYCWNIVVLSYK